LIRGFYPDDLEPHRVPPEFCVPDPMGAGEYYDSGERQRIYVIRASNEKAKTDITEALRLLTRETWDRRSIFEVEAMQHFQESKTPLWRELRELVPAPPPGWADKGWELYMSTH